MKRLIVFVLLLVGVCMGQGIPFPRVPVLTAAVGPSIVQVKTDWSGGAPSVSGSITCTSGNTLWWPLFAFADGATFVTTTSTGNTITAVHGPDNGGSSTSAQVVVNNCNGTTGTYTNDCSSGSCFSSAVEITGTHVAAPVDASAVASGTGTAVSAAITTTGNNELVIAWCVANTPFPVCPDTPNAGWTAVRGSGGNDPNFYWKISSTATETLTLTLGSSANWMVQLVAFKPGP